MEEKKFTKVLLNPGKDESLKRFHPWVFSGAIKKTLGEAGDGDIVEVQSSKGDYLGTGHYAKGSITVRVFSFDKTYTEQRFWKTKIQKAYNYRKQLGLVNNPDTNVYRLLFAEGDGMPGLIIDFYNGTAVLQSHSVGMHLVKPQIIQALQEIYRDGLKAIYDKSEESMPKQAEIKATNGLVWGVTETNEVKENGHTFYIDWEHGQKTGFFIDQRESRKLLGEYSKDKMVLNTFCYTGGFSVYAANAGAKEVHSVDSSKKAIALTDKNIELNNIQNHKSFAEDTFDFLKGKENIYDVIILDPPAFAKHQNVKHNAVLGYRKLNEAAIRAIKPNGILFTYSCSQVIDRKLFYNTVMAAAILAGRNIRVMHHLSQPADHPVNIFHPEGEYLKGLVLYVE